MLTRFQIPITTLAAIALTILTSSCASSPAPSVTSSKSTLAPRCFGSPALQVTSLTPAGPGGGGGCHTQWVITVQRNSDGSVSVPNTEIDEGDCVSWEYPFGRVTLVDFISPAEPHVPNGKMRSSHNLPDISCNNNEHPCGQLNTTPMVHGGVLFYQVTVMEGTVTKMTDPTIVVDCATPPCMRGVPPCPH